MEEKIASIRSQLLNRHQIKVKLSWITEFIQFYSRSLPNFNSIPEGTILSEAFDQFVLANVKDASNPVIPMVIIQKREIFTLNGKFVLQMQYLIDISETPFEQHRRLHNLKTDTAEERQKESKTFATKKKRMFKLELTDGHKTIHAIEYTTIPSLNTKLSPGVKILLTGPIKVSNHLLLLEAKNLKILGGDVEDIFVTNAYENVLLRALKRPITQTPIRNYTEDTMEIDPPSRPVPKPVQPIAQIDSDEDVDMEMLMQIEREAQNQRQQVPANLVETEEDDDDILGQIEAIENQVLRDTPMDTFDSSSRPKPKALELLIPNNYVPTEDPETDWEYNQPPPRKIARIEPARPVSFSDSLYPFVTNNGDPIVTIDQYLKGVKPVQRVQKNFVIYGDVEKVGMNTLRVNNGQWKLHGEISDEFSKTTIAVRFHNKILEEVSGKTALEMKAMYDHARSRPQVKEDIKQIAEKLQLKLLSEKRFMKLEMSFNGMEPGECILKEIVECSSQNLEMFHKKVREENLSKPDS